MRINKILVSALVMALSFYSCDYLDVPPINIIQDDAIFNSESGITSYMTTLYYDLPIEDFRSPPGYEKEPVETVFTDP